MMTTKLEIPNVSERLHQALSDRAEDVGLPLSEFLIGVLERLVEETTPEELLERLSRITPVDLGNLTSAQIIREGREERTDQIIDAITRR